MRSTRLYLLWASLGLLLFWTLYSLRIDLFPPFLDEAVIIHFGEQIKQTGPLAFAFEGRQFTNWYFLLFQPYLAGTLWVARIAILLMGLLGFSAVLGIGRAAAGGWGMVFTALLYGFSAYHFFYTRLALSDITGSSTGLVALYFAFRFSKRINYRDALCVGILIFFAIGFKLSAFAWIGVPFAAVISLRPLASLRKELRQRSVWLITAAGSALIPTAVYWLVLVARGYKPLSTIIPYASSGPSTRLVTNNLLPNLNLMITVLSTYWGVAVLGITVAALLILTFRRRLFLPLCFVGPLCIVLLSERQTARYWFSASSILLLALAIVLAHIAAYRKTVGYLIGTALVIWVGIQWIPFALPLYTDPWQVSLPQSEYSEYVMSDASGFGLREIIDVASQQGTSKILGLLANCQSLQYLALTKLTVECPPIDQSASNLEGVSEQAAAALQSGSAVVLERSIYFPETIAGKAIFTIDRPGSIAPLTLYTAP